jgi:hypothetical protein
VNPHDSGAQKINDDVASLIASVLRSGDTQTINGLIHKMVPEALRSEPHPEVIKIVIDALHKQTEIVRHDEFRDMRVTDWKRVRAAIEHENTLVNHRLTWLLTSQGFLLAGFGAIYKSGLNTIYDLVILAIIAIAGIASSYRILIEIAAAHDQLSKLDQWWHETHGAVNYEFDQEPRKTAYEWLRKRHPDIQRRSDRESWYDRFLKIELIFIVTWILIIFGVITKPLTSMWTKISLVDADGWHLALCILCLALAIVSANHIYSSFEHDRNRGKGTSKNSD